MPHFFDRYVAGDHELVWEELVALGAAALEPPISVDAVAVAEELVDRVVENVRIVERFLVDAGYEFAAPRPGVVGADERTAESVEQIEREYGRLPLVLKTWWSRVDRLELRQSDDQFTSGAGCHVTGISPSSDIMLDSPSVCLQQSRERSARIREENAARTEHGESPEVMLDPDAPFLILGPCASNNDDVGFRMPVDAVDAACDNEGLNWTLVTFLRNALLSKGGLRWMHFGRVRQPDGAMPLQSVVRPMDEVTAIVDAMNLRPF